MIKPTVSIIVPIYNAEAYLERCLKSICAQTLQNIEIICINDASNDKSLDIIHSFQEMDYRVKCINLQSNVGESKARNIGINNAKGEYIGSVDNDDYVDIDFFELLYKKAKENNSDIVKANCIEINGNIIKECTEINKNISKDKTNFFSFWWSAIYKLDFINRNCIVFPENIILGGDLVFLCRAIVKSNVVSVINNTFYHYCRRSNSGDSQVLVSQKVNDVLQSYEIITNIYDEEIGYCISEEQYINRYCEIIRNILFGIAQRCELSADSVRCIIFARHLIEKCRVKKVLIKNIEEKFPLLIKCVLKGDIYALKKYINKNMLEVFAAKLRTNMNYLHKKK